jgi:hypothetical protein
LGGGHSGQAFQPGNGTSPRSGKSSVVWKKRERDSVTGWIVKSRSTLHRLLYHLLFNFKHCGLALAEIKKDERAWIKKAGSVP